MDNLASVSVPGRAILFPHIYTIDRAFGYERHDVCVSNAEEWLCDNTTRDVLKQFMTPKGLVRFASKLRPEVVVQDYSDSLTNAAALDRMVTELNRLDARNISRDKIFQIADIVTIFFSVYYYNFRHASGYGLSLNKIGISL